MTFVSRLPLVPLIPQVNIFKLFSQDRGKMMICFSLFPDNGDTFQFEIPLKVYKCNLKIHININSANSEIQYNNINTRVDSKMTK